MAILAIGGTGQIGSLVVKELIRRDAKVGVLGTKAPDGKLPVGAELVIGDVFDVPFMRSLLDKASTLFVLHPAAPDELARALLTVALMDEAKIKGVVYLSMMGADRFANASRAAAKFATEMAIKACGLSATILRPNAVFQNDTALRAAISQQHVYATPIGSIGVTLVDARDVAEVAALELLRREQSAAPLPTETIEVVGPEAFTGKSIARLWSEVIGEPVTYTGDDLDAVEQAMSATMPASSAYDLKLVFRGILREGVLGQPGAHTRLTKLLGRPLRRYRDFAEEMAGDETGAVR